MSLSVPFIDLAAIKARLALFARGLRNQRRVIGALMLRESRTRYGDSALGFGWALIDPMTELLTMYALYGFVRGRAVPINAPLSVFLLTGIFPFYFWRQSVQLGAQAEKSNQALLVFPQVTVIDCILARVMLEGSTTLVVYHIVMLGLILFTGVPLSYFYDEPLNLLLAWAALFYASVSSAILSSALARMFPSWPTIFGYLGRILFLTSGTFFTLASLESGVRALATYNPLAHILEWMRSAAISTFESDLYSPAFVLISFTIVLFLGLALDRIAIVTGHVQTRGHG